jgi:hypothetical protein
VFSTRGTVTSIDIRCCSGSVVPSGARGATVYATVLFANVEDATHALSLNGDTLLGERIVVRSSATCRDFSHRCIAFLAGHCQFSQLARGQTRCPSKIRPCLWCRLNKTQVCQASRS